MPASSLLSAETRDLAKDFSTDKNPNSPCFCGYGAYAREGRYKPLAELPADFENQLKAIGYE